MGEQAVLERHTDELDTRLADLGLIAPGQATRKPTSGDDEDFGFRFDGPGDLGDPYLD